MNAIPILIAVAAIVVVRRGIRRRGSDRPSRGRRRFVWLQDRRLLGDTGIVAAVRSASGCEAVCSEW